MIAIGDWTHIPAYFHNLTLQIDGYEGIAPIGLSERLGVMFNILGYKGTFYQFQVCFNDHIGKVTLERISNWEDPDVI